MKPTLKLDIYPVLRMQRKGDMLLFQPWWQDEVVGDALVIDLEKGSHSLSKQPAIENDYSVVYGILGMVELTHDLIAVVTVTQVETVANLRGHPLLEVKATKVLMSHQAEMKKKTKAEKYVYSLLKAGTDPQLYGGKMYFSPGGDCTLTEQRYRAAIKDMDTYTATPAWKRAESAFFWNFALSKPLLDSGMEKFVPTVFVGFVEQLSQLDLSRNGETWSGTITLVARRSCRRPGTRQWRRGADLAGDVANFVESEQLLSLRGGSSVDASFVQVRGSIPVLWSQSPNLQYKIPITIAPRERCEPVLFKHVQQLSSRYGKVTAISLANQTGREGKLTSSYASTASVVSSTTDNNSFRLVCFDFHKYCGATKYQNLKILWDAIVKDFEAYGMWTLDNLTGSYQTQRGVFRTNCIDTLDRTNVVQGMLARHGLEHVLRQYKILREGETFASTFPLIEISFRTMWADHGDEISRQYAGTGAMKSAFTRTGKRDVAGLLDDGMKSVTRYFLNNFHDGFKQDALDLVTGTFRVDELKSSHGKDKLRGIVRPQASPAIPLIFAVGMFAMGIRNLQNLAASGEAFTAKTIPRVWTLFLMAGLVVRLVFKFGAHLVDAPALRPDLTSPWHK